MYYTNNLKKQMCPSKKYSIALKISKLIKLYAEIEKLDRYIVSKIWKDSNKYKYFILLLEEKKIFEHSKYFKENKSTLINRRGDKLKEYYTSFKSWKKTQLKGYMEIKNYLYNLIDKDCFDTNDMIQLNKLYRNLKLQKYGKNK